MGIPLTLRAALCGSLLAGCMPRYATLVDVPVEQSPLLKNIERYYFAKAKEQAAFMGRCPVERITAQVVSSRPAPVWVSNRETSFFTLTTGKEIANIGTEACGLRMIFQVICGPNQLHGSVATPPYGRPARWWPGQQPVLSSRTTTNSIASNKRKRPASNSDPGQKADHTLRHGRGSRDHTPRDTAVRV